MPLYRAYDLILASDLPIPELQPAEGEADVRIEVRVPETRRFRESPAISCTSASPSRVHLRWGGVGDLWIEEGRRIAVIPAFKADPESLRLFILGAGLGVLLHQRGLLVLHASGVAIDGAVVGFTGAKGWGKSTTAASLQQRGHALVSDELLVVRFDAQNQPLVIPGPAQMRLWSDALISIGGDPRSAVRVRTGIDKFNIDALNVAPREYPLRCIYLLDVGAEFSVEPLLLPSDAFFGVIPHLYVYRFGTSYLQSTGAARTFLQLSLLLRAITVKRLLRQRDLGQLPNLAQLVEQDVLQEWKKAL